MSHRFLSQVEKFDQSKFLGSLNVGTMAAFALPPIFLFWHYFRVQPSKQNFSLKQKQVMPRNTFKNAISRRPQNSYQTEEELKVLLHRESCHGLESYRSKHMADNRVIASTWSVSRKIRSTRSCSKQLKFGLGDTRHGLSLRISDKT